MVFQCLVYELIVSVFQTGTCALFFACQGGFIDVVKVLLEHNASVDLASFVSVDLASFVSCTSAFLLCKFPIVLIPTKQGYLNFHQIIHKMIKSFCFECENKCLNLLLL